MIINKTHLANVAQIVRKTMNKWADQDIVITSTSDSRIFLRWNGEKYILCVWSSEEYAKDKYKMFVSLFHDIRAEDGSRYADEVVSKNIRIDLT